MNKKGQAAMEFLMTYGWAILVVIAAIAALAYFGVLDPSRLLPEKCEFPSGLDCVDKAAIVAAATPNGQVNLALKNNIGFQMTITGVNPTATVGTCGAVDSWHVWTTVAGVPTDNGANTSVTVNNNEGFRVQVFCGNTLTAGNKFSDNFIITYTNMETALSHDAVGTVRGKM